MKYALGADHAGADLKDELKAHLEALGVVCQDFGTQAGQSVDYPDVAQEVARRVASGDFERGILVCGTGIGMSISANKVEGIRAALVGDIFSAGMAGAHNNAQILCLGSRVIGAGLAKAITSAYHEACFEGGRHQRRIDKIHSIEGNSP